jgi:hypothetical protein
MKNLAPLKAKDIVSIIVLIIIGFSWILVDQIFLKQANLRFIAFIVLMVALFQIQFWINKPQQIWHYANSLSLILLLFVITSSLVMHVLIYHNFAKMKYHSFLIWIITGLMPYLTALFYRVTKRT